MGAGNFSKCTIYTTGCPYYLERLAGRCEMAAVTSEMSKCLNITNSGNAFLYRY